MEPPKQKQKQQQLNILIGLSGSVATIKYLDLLIAILSKFPSYNVQIKLLATKNSLYFLQEDHQKTLKISISNQEIPILLDENEWTWKNKGDTILHIELRKWADIFLIAPLSANTLAKISNGLCDNLLVFSSKYYNFIPK